MMTTRAHTSPPSAGLYSPAFEHDSCGFGLIAQMDDRASHWLVRTAVDALARLTHRGAVAADGKTGDGCGLLLKKPHAFLETVAAHEGFTLTPEYAVGMVFFAQDPGLRERARTILAEELRRDALDVTGWRTVPTDPSVCGSQALATLPHIESQQSCSSTRTSLSMW